MRLEVLERYINELKWETSSVFSTASIVIGSLVSECTEELVDDIAESTMQLDSIEACLFGEDE